MQSSMILKLCVAADYLDKPLKNTLFIAGYVNGSTRGFTCQILLYFLLHCKRSPWDVVEVKAALDSFCRLKVNIVHHVGPISRHEDAMRVPDVDTASCM